MNDEEGLFSTRDSLPEEVKKNTIAMGEYECPSLFVHHFSTYCSYK